MGQEKIRLKTTLDVDKYLDQDKFTILLYTYAALDELPSNRSTMLCRVNATLYNVHFDKSKK